MPRKSHIPSVFPSWQAYSDFARRVKSNERYVRSAETSQFLDLLTATASSRRRTLESDSILWRARLGFSRESFEQDLATQGKAKPHLLEQMKPLSNAPSEGRVNPIGIPILYLATDEKTAVAEVRQWIGKFVSVAQFKVLRDVQLIDCSLEYSEGYEWHEVELKPAEREHVVWRELGRAYSEPVSLDTRPTDYVPTQIIAEHFRAHGADGIVYQSAVGGG